MFGEIAKTFGATFLVTQFFPAVILLFFHLLDRAQATQVGSLSERTWGALRLLIEMPVSRLAVCVLLATVMGVLFQMFQSLLVKVYEGYFSKELIWLGSVLIILSVATAWAVPIFRPSVEFVGSAAAAMLLTGLMQLLTVRIHRRLFISRRHEITNLGAKDPERLRKEFDITRAYPPSSKAIMATKLGNVIRAFEYHPMQLYSMDPISNWPRLIAVIPNSYRRLLEQTESSTYAVLNLGFVAFLLGWELLTRELVGHSFLTWPLWVACLGIAWLLYWRTCGEAANWGEVVRGAFDLYRHALLSQLGVNVPQTPITLAEEQKLWRAIQRVTYYLEDPGTSIYKPKPWVR